MPIMFESSMNLPGFCWCICTCQRIFPSHLLLTCSLADCCNVPTCHASSLPACIIPLLRQGALCMLLGVTLAAMNAFLLARGVGRPLAQKVRAVVLQQHAMPCSACWNGEGLQVPGLEGETTGQGHSQPDCSDCPAALALPGLPPGLPSPCSCPPSPSTLAQPCCTLLHPAQVIEAEMSHAGEAGSGGAVATKLAEVQAAIEGGGPLQQLTAIALLRLTPVVPFSASNYLLGLTPVQLPPYLGGTLVGMSVWSVLYASIGGASRQLLENGADIGDLIAGEPCDMLRRGLPLVWYCQCALSWPWAG